MPTFDPTPNLVCVNQIALTRRVPADAVLNLSGLAGQPDVPCASSEVAEKLARIERDNLLGKEAYVTLAESWEGVPISFDRPIRVRVTSMDTDRWMDDTYLDTAIGFEFLEPVDPDTFFPDPSGKQRGWVYGTTYTVSE